MHKSTDRNARQRNQDLPMVAGSGSIDRGALLGRGVSDAVYGAAFAE